jgi:hypothetical protein
MSFATFFLVARITFFSLMAALLKALACSASCTRGRFPTRAAAVSDSCVTASEQARSRSSDDGRGNRDLGENGDIAELKSTAALQRFADN